MSSTSVQKGGDVERVEHVRARGGGGGIKRHCARRWWIYLIVSLAVILAVILGLLFGVLPAIAQKTVNDSKLTVSSISITNPEPDSFTYAQNATVTGKVPVTAHLNPQRIAMFLEPAKGEDAHPFMYLNVSRLDLTDSVAINVADYPMEVSNLTAFEEFTKLSLSADTFQLALKSRPELFTGSLHNYVDFNKVVDLKGFNGLAGAKIYNQTVLDKPLEDGTNMLATFYIDNTSTFTLQVGDMTANFFLATSQLGYGVVKDLTLKQGVNRVQINGHLLPAFYPGAKVLVEAGGMNITVTGNSTIRDDKHIPWLEAALNSLPLTVEVMKNGTSP